MAEIQNPNQQGGGQDSKSLLTFTVIFFVLFLGLQFFLKPKPPAANPAQQAPATSRMQPSAPASAAAQTTATAGPVTQAASESTTVVENNLYRITFSNRGAQVTSWVLKKYKDDEGNPLDLVNHEAAAKYGYPLSLYTYDANLRGQLQQALYVPSAVGALHAPGTLSFEYAFGGLTVRKTFRFDASYVIHAEVSVLQNGAPVEALLCWPAGFGDQDSLPHYASATLDIAQNGKAEQQTSKKISGGATLRGPFDWAGVSDLYFAAIFLPENPKDLDLVTLHNTISVPRNRKNPDPRQTDQAPVLGAAMGAAQPYSVRLFAGPKSLDVLASVPTSGVSLEKTVNFGMWGIISKPLFLALRFLYEHVVPNWGWAILILTFVLNLAMLPTRFQMMKSSLKMQRIQPQIEAIKAKYAKYKATDPRRQEMNREVFELQRREGVNMFGGCIPMLIQWPLLFAFYRMLGNVIELRQAHWLWLPDLSSPDPLHILPLFFIVSMFLVQWLTPSPGVDPAQQRMMAFTMPAVFGFMTWNVGSGLALYWAGSNILGIMQQMLINRTTLGKEMRALALKRAARRTGKPALARR
ncbi:membrane protein insertase YidC [Pseudacidobacterium ailaaui]|uniref:membrane protein insertase YidC n=1 Tax=Pseudacidobacterium ailaaui TaxID=1382359 RepID=UPI000479A984|nr:membrane protein insertase YidC [Pseudacidobacterium ailaaui]MBX6361577.1 membrane protein insertase YidC [Pseudacidobacterium ailaaui]MDI3255519.1 membrane protein insertase YidC [Bacillota bacterium]